MKTRNLTFSVKKVSLHYERVKILYCFGSCDVAMRKKKKEELSLKQLDSCLTCNYACFLALMCLIQLRNLSHARDETKNTFLYFFKELKTCHLSYFVYFILSHLFIFFSSFHLTVLIVTFRN